MKKVRLITEYEAMQLKYKGIPYTDKNAIEEGELYVIIPDYITVSIMKYGRDDFLNHFEDITVTDIKKYLEI